VNKAQLLELKHQILSQNFINPLINTLFYEQRMFIIDDSKKKLACCTRRAGKSHVAAIALLSKLFAVNNATALYIGLTRPSAKAILWAKLKEITASLKLDIHYKEAELQAVYNNSNITLYGANQENLIDRLRGNKYSIVVIDEAQSFDELVITQLINDVLEPATLDYNAPILLLGTPAPKLAGYFYEQDQVKAIYSKHKWSVLNNIHIPHAGNWIEELKKTNNWNDNNPTYRREYCGEWCHDPDALVYKINSSNIGITPDKLDSYMIGVDFGWQDETAFVVIGWNEHDTKAYVVHSESHQHMVPAKIAEKLIYLTDKYDSIRIVADTGGLGKSIVEDFKYRYSMNITAAEKKDKNANIEVINSDFADSRIVIDNNNTKLIHELNILTWTEDRKEDPSLPNHLCFVGNTVIYGDTFKRIKDIAVNEYVYTLYGNRLVIASECTGIQKTVIAVFSNLSILHCTPDHPVILMDGTKKPLIQLSWEDECIKHRYSMVSNIQNTIWKNIIPKHLRVKLTEYIQTLGYILKVLSQLVMTFTILMAMLIIIPSKTLFFYLKKNITLSILKAKENGQQVAETLNCYQKLETSQKSGTPQKKAMSGIKNTMLNHWLRRVSRILSKYVPSAVKNIWLLIVLAIEQSFVLINAMLKIEGIRGLTISLKLVAIAARNILQINTGRQSSVTKIALIIPEKHRKTYNLTVQSEHHYYANGILVSNSDAMNYVLRYSRHYWATPRVDLTEEQQFINAIIQKDMETQEYGNL